MQAGKSKGLAGNSGWSLQFTNWNPTRNLNIMAKVILSAYRATLSMAENVQRTSELAYDLEKMNLLYRVATGYYQERGQAQASAEVSFVVSCTEREADKLVALGCGKYQQDCVLKVGLDGVSSLNFDNNGGWQEIGRWLEVSAERAMTEVCRTFMAGKWFIVV